MSPDTVKTILSINRDLLLYSAPAEDDVKTILESSRRGAIGILDLEYLDADSITRSVEELKKSKLPFGVRIDPMSDKLMTLMSGDVPENMRVLVSISKEGLPAMVRTGVYDTAHDMKIKVFQEVCTREEAEDAADGGCDAIIIRPFEGGGRVSSLESAELLKEVRSVSKEVPVLIRGGFAKEQIEKIEVEGYVLDQEIFGPYYLPMLVKKSVSAEGEPAVITLMKDIGRTMRFIAGPNEIDELTRLEKDLMAEGEPKEVYKALKTEIKDRIEKTIKGQSLLYPAGETALKGPSVPLDEILPAKTISNSKGIVMVNGKPVPPDYHDKSIAIVGMGTVFPKGIGLETFWKSVLDGVDACMEIPKERWDWKLHYDPDPSKPNKSYTKIGAFVTDFKFSWIDFKIPPKVAEKIDLYQKFGLVAATEALKDSSLLETKGLDLNRVGVIVANSAGGENRDWVSTRINFEEVHVWMQETEIWKDLPEDARKKLYEQTRERVDLNTIDITEDTMPGSLPNIASGRLSNTFNFRGPNMITDAACASALAAMFVARNSLLLGQIDAALSGGLESLMSSHGFVEFCKIGALTPDGSRPFSDGANGFLMGEGAGIVVLKRLEDAVANGDKIYAVVRGIGGSSDGKGKGITAPNPEGQRLAVQRAMEDADIERETISFIEAHGTSTAVGDVAEVNSLKSIFGGLPRNSIGLTSVKSQIGHLKSAAGVAGVVKAAMAVNEKVLPPQINFEKPNHYIKWEETPFYVITEPKEWNRIAPDIPRRCSVSAFGFGGTNFNVVLEEFDRDIYDAWKRSKDSKPEIIPESVPEKQVEPQEEIPVDMEGIRSYLEKEGHKEGEAFLFSSDNPMDLLKQASKAVVKAKEIVEKGGRLRDAFSMPSYEGRYRLGIMAKDPDHFEKQVETLKKVGMNEKALMALMNKGIFVGDRERMDHGKVCFMFPGQGSQYINMFRDLSEKYRVVKETFGEADRVMADLIDDPLSSYVFKDLKRGDPGFDEASEMLRRTEFNQPSMLTVDTAMYQLLRKLGVEPDLVMGHSLGEYGALIASGIMSFDDALRAVSARGKEMRDLKVDDVGKMASVMAGLKEVEEVLKDIDGYVIPANKNCHVQTVIAGNTEPVEKAVEKFKEMGIDTVIIPVSHAFHSEVVAPAKVPLRNYLSKLDIKPPKIPVLSNVTADLYPMKGSPEEIKEKVLDLLKEQVAHSVEWMGEIDRAYKEGCRTFIEVGPKRALTSFAYNLMEEDVKKGNVFPITSNHPKKGGIQTYNEMVASLWSLGFDLKIPDLNDDNYYNREFIEAFKPYVKDDPKEEPVQEVEIPAKKVTSSFESFKDENSDLIEEFLKKVYERMPEKERVKEPVRRDVDLSGTGATVPSRKGAKVVISGAAMGLPGTFKNIFDPNNLGYLVEGRNLIENIDEQYLDRFIDKHIVRLDKKPDGSAEMVTLDDPSMVVKLSGKLGKFDLVEEFGVPESLNDVIDITTRMAFASALLALKDAGIPLVKRYAQTSTGSFLPEEWELPLEMQEDTGIVFASAFPGTNNLIDELTNYFTAKFSKAGKEEKQALYDQLKEKVKGTDAEAELDSWFESVRSEPESTYDFPRLFMFEVLAMGHSQFAQYIKAKGPNTQVNSACASSTLAVSIAQDWIQMGRCKRVIVLGADDPASDTMIEWFGSSLLAMGALTPEKDVTQAALPFDRRRKGMIIGSGAAALIVEAEEEPRRRGMHPIVEVLGSHIANSAFHGSRLDIAHIARSMDHFITCLEKEWSIDRYEIAPDMIFMSHETYTPARGGSSAAEVESLRRTFGDKYRDILIMNTKGYTGHAFGACIEDPVLIKCLEEGVAVPLANLTPDQIDPQFEGLQLSSGGKHNRHYGLRIAAGFGSQLAFLLVRKPDVQGRYISEEEYDSWLRSVATTEPVELEVYKNNLRLKDQGRENLIPSRAVKRESSAIGYTKARAEDIDRERFEDYKERVITIFSEKTGVPGDMIEIDADLETDLGIDSVKQVELFGAARIAFDLPKDEGVNLRDYPTLRDVIHYIMLKKEGRDGWKKTEPEEKKEEPEPEEETEVKETGKGDWESVKDRVVSIVSEKTGYPEDMLDIDLDLEADLGIDTVKQVELFGMARGEFDLPKDDSINLSDFNTLRKIVDYVMGKSGGKPSSKEEEKIPEEAPGKENESVEGEKVPEKGEKPPEKTENRWESVKDRIITIVSEKTGYPEDMLELDLDLEADLGIDTVKQVELFGMARGEFDLPKDDSINLSDFNTLRKIVDYVMERSGGEAEVEPDQTPEQVEEKAPPEVSEEISQEEAPSESSEPGAADWESVKDRVVSIVAEKTGYPEDMLELDLDLEADLGIDTVKQVELFGMARGEFDLPKDDSINLSDFNTLRKIVDYVMDRSGRNKQVKPEEKVREEVAEEKPEQPVEEPETEKQSDGADWESVKDRVVSIVAEKTGYPVDMLELDLDLEADLGIDTVKQVELFGMARGEFDLPKDDSINLSDFNTLRKIVDYVMGNISEKESESEAEKKEAPDAEAESVPEEEQVPELDEENHWDNVKEKVVSIVAEKTGYPEDMLELDLDLEADLGIDTVKQVELFGMARGEFNLPKDDSVNLSEFPTLRHIIDYVSSKMLEGSTEEKPVKEQEEEKLSIEQLKERINRWVLRADEREPLPDPKSKPLKGKKLIVYGASKEEADLVSEILGCDADAYPENEEGDLSAYDGIVNLYPLRLSGTSIPDDWDKETEMAVKVLFRIVKSMEKVLKNGGYLLSITGMGGRFGLGKDPNPIHGAVAGFTKAVNREFPESVSMVLDVDLGSDIRDIFYRLSKEISSDHGLPEVGWDGKKGYRPILRIFEPPRPEFLELRDGMNILVTGGGSGITAEIVRELSKKAKLDLHLTGRTRVLEDVERLAGLDENELKAEKDAIKERLKSEGEKVTPVKIEREFSKITKSVTIHNLTKSIESSGSRGQYHAVDVTDMEKMSKLSQEHGPFHAVIHAAGVEQSKLITNKTQADFNRVFDTKVKGARAVIEATRDHPLALFMSFSSVAGRFGNAGQVDYSAANDCLSKMTGSIRSLHPECVVKSVGWSAWSDVGMASKGSVKTILEIGGVTFIPVEKGVQCALDEMQSGIEREILYCGSMGPLDREGTLLWEDGINATSDDHLKNLEEELPPSVQIGEETGIKEESTDGKIEDFSKEAVSPLLDSIIEKDEKNIVAVKVLDTEKELFLKDHSIMNTPVIPGVMVMETFAEVAKALRPELDVIGMKDVRFMKAVNVKDRHEIRIEGSIQDDDELEKIVEMKLTSKDPKSGKEVTHFTGNVILGSSEDVCRIQEGHPLRPDSVKAQVLRDEIYQHLFHGQLFQVTAGMSVLTAEELLGTYRIPEGTQFHGDTGWKDEDLVTPALQTELGFQAAGAYVLDRFDMMALPVRVGEISYSSRMRTSDKAFAWVRFTEKIENEFSFDVDILDENGNIRFSYRDYRLKSLMANKVELKGDHSVRFEEVLSPVKGTRVFRLDMDAFQGDPEDFKNHFSSDEWSSMDSEKMTDKRKREHILGRMVSKLGVSWYVNTTQSRPVSLSDIVIETEEGGRPYAILDGKRVEISISHSHRWAVCSVGDRQHGTDIELSESRDMAFSDEAFDPQEVQLLRRIQEEMDIEESLAQTLLFSAKEAYLKMMGTGLRTDLKKVSCTDVLKLPARSGLAFEILVGSGEKISKVEATVQSAYVLTVCQKR